MYQVQQNYPKGIDSQKAGTSITLGPGFQVDEGNTFTASIGEVITINKGYLYVKNV